MIFDCWPLREESGILRCGYHIRLSVSREPSGSNVVTWVCPVSGKVLSGEDAAAK